MKKIAVMTSGGDAPGMNACVRSVVRYGMNAGVSVLGIRRGFAGLMNNDIIEMDSRSVGGIIRLGGTILMSARALEFKTPEGQQLALETISAWGIEGVVVIGGDGSLHGARTLHELGIPTIGVPASIDNDIAFTEMAIGVDTALNTILDAVDKIKDTASAHQRAFIIEVMGRRHGYLALMSGVAGGAELIILPNTEIDPVYISREVKTAALRGKPHFIIIVAEGAEMEGEERVTAKIAHVVQDAGFDPRVTVLGHVQRGGSPTAFDRLLGTRFGARAVENLLAGESGTMACLHADHIITKPLEEVLSTPVQLREDILALVQPLAR
ncbi:MAG: 6-phosphofructokinase [Armatimonadota bacterium]